jgi:hypothetical protein
VVFAATLGCGDESHSGAGGAAGAGGTPFQDIPCSLEEGCIVADLDLTFQCTAPDDGSGVTEWQATIARVLQGGAVDGFCQVNDSYGPNTLFLDAGGQVRITKVPFMGAGSYHLGGDAMLGFEEFNVQATGYRGNPSQFTYANSLDTCSMGCTLEVSPAGHGLAAVGEWMTYRFVVTCEGPLGTEGAVPSCGQCTMQPNSVIVDAACFFPPPMM